MAELSKLKITVLDDPYDGNREINLPFNPPDFSLAKGAQISEIAIPGIDSPLLQFIHGTNEKLTLKLFFDTTDESSDVRDKTKDLYKIAKDQ